MKRREIIPFAVVLSAAAAFLPPQGRASAAAVIPSAAAASTAAGAGAGPRSEDGVARLEIPGESAAELQDGAPPGVTRTIVLMPAPSAGFLAAYDIRVKEGETFLDGFTFMRKSFGIYLKISLPAAHQLRGTQALPPAGSPLVLYYNDGLKWRKLGAVADVLGQEAVIPLRRVGQFAVKYETLAAGFSFTRVAPRIFSPDEDNPAVNQACFDFVNQTGVEVTIKIFDLTGARIRRNIARGPVNNQFCWDGRDDGGGIVKGGVYIYQIEAAGEVSTGTVVVAK